MKKIIIVSVIVFLVLAIALSLVVLAIMPKTYSSAQKSTKRFLDRNSDELTEIANDAISGGREVSGYYKDRYYSYTPTQNYVEFNIDAQGFLGGQYWSLVYTPDGMFHGETQELLKKETNGGNNILRATRIDEHWWFTWIDYDGTERSYK